MLSGILEIMGINMGKELDDANREDQVFLGHLGNRQMLQNKESQERIKFIESIKEQVKTKNNSYNIWGWKDPLSIYYITDIAPLLRNPIYIWITRDLIAISEREFLAQQPKRGSIHSYSYVDATLNQYRVTNEFLSILSEQNRPVLLVSYERSLRSPESLYLSLAEFIGLKKDFQTLNKIIDYVQPDRLTGSLEHSSISSYEGEIEDYEKYQHNLTTELKKSRALDLFYETESNHAPLDAVIKEAELEMLEGNYQACASKLQLLLYRFKNVFSMITLGPKAISEALRYDSGKLNTELVPDIVVKILYLIAMSKLQINNPKEAIIWFAACYDLATKKLMYRDEELPECEEHIVWAKFHEAYLAKQLGSSNLLFETRNELTAIKYSTSYIFSDKIKENYKKAMERSQKEL